MSADKVKSKNAKESSLSKDIKYLLYSAGSCKNLRGIHPVVRSKLNFNEVLIFQMVYTKAVKRKVLDKRYKKIADLKLRKTITREYLESVIKLMEPGKEYLVDYNGYIQEDLSVKRELNQVERIIDAIDHYTSLIPDVRHEKGFLIFSHDGVEIVRGEIKDESRKNIGTILKKRENKPLYYYLQDRDIFKI